MTTGIMPAPQWLKDQRAAQRKHQAEWVANTTPEERRAFISRVWAASAEQHLPDHVLPRGKRKIQNF